MPRINTIVCFLFPVLQASAQAPLIDWERTYGGTSSEFARSIQRTADGGCVMAGVTSSNDGDVTGQHGEYDAWVVKVDAVGTIEWQTTLGGSDYDGANAVLQAADGGFVFAGYSASTDGDVLGVHGGDDGWVVKLNAAGELQWQLALGGSGDELFNAIVASDDGGYLIAGTTDSNDGDVAGAHGLTDIWVAGIDADGALSWQRTLGGTGHDQGNAIALLPDGYLVAGLTDSNDGDVSGNHGIYDAWLVKVEAAGGVAWQTAAGGSSSESFRDIRATADGGSIAVGHAISEDGDVVGNHGGSDGWVVKVNAAGEVEWQQALGGSGTEELEQVCILEDGYAVAGTTWSADGDVSGQHGAYDAWVVRLDEMGALEWQRALGGNVGDQSEALIALGDEGYLVCGSTGSNNGDVAMNHGVNDAWLVKLAADPSTGIASMSWPLVTIAPNPSSGEVMITAEDGRPLERISVCQPDGRKVAERMNTARATVMRQDLSSLPCGSYLLRAWGPDRITTIPLLLVR